IASAAAPSWPASNLVDGIAEILYASKAYDVRLKFLVISEQTKRGPALRDPFDVPTCVTRYFFDALSTSFASRLLFRAAAFRWRGRFRPARWGSRTASS